MYCPKPGKADSKAVAVSVTPSTSVVCQTLVIKIARAVNVQTTNVSIVGPSIATKPSLMGSSVFAAP